MDDVVVTIKLLKCNFTISFSSRISPDEDPTVKKLIKVSKEDYAYMY